MIMSQGHDTPKGHEKPLWNITRVHYHNKDDMAQTQILAMSVLRPGRYDLFSTSNIAVTKYGPYTQYL